MKYRQLGSSELQVSEISLGSWLTYSGGVPRDQAETCVDKAFELGINFIDTANVYGRGKAEEFLGEVLSRRERSSYVLATKLYFRMSETDRGLSRAQVEKQIEASLRRLKIDYVDLYQCHRYDQDTPLDETMEALSDAVRAGKARYLGFSEWSAEQIQASLDLPDVARRTSIWPSIYPRILEQILAHRSTIVFCNARRQAERLAAKLNELYDEQFPPAGEGGAAEASWSGRITVHSPVSSGYSSRTSSNAVTCVPSSRYQQPRARHRHGCRRPRRAGRVAWSSVPWPPAHRPRWPSCRRAEAVARSTRSTVVTFSKRRSSPGG